MKIKYINKENIKTVMNYYKKRDKSSEKALVIQVADMIKLWRMTGYLPYNYFKYGKSWQKSENVMSVVKYIPGRLFDEIREEYLNDKTYICLLDDKYVFNKWMKAHGVPVTNMLKMYSPKDEIHASELEQFFGNSPGIVIKPSANSAQGDGVAIINNKSEIKDFTAGLEGSKKTSLLVEEKILQHKTIEAIYSHSVNTVRIDTLMDTDGEVYIISALLRVGRNGRKVDNWSGSKGGIAISINLETGQLSLEGVDYYSKKYRFHPDTKVVFSGIQIPFWKQLRECVLKAAKALPGIASVGWDVAVTPDGPVIIEGNSDYTIQLMQAASGPHSENKNFVRIINNYMREKKKYIRSFTKIVNANIDSIS